MENKDTGSVIGSQSAPFINSLANVFGLATDYSAISHPSLPNYIALTSGSAQGITDDSDPSSHPLNVPSIFSELPAGSSRSLEQDMPSNCATGNSGDYAVRHNPEAYYTNLGSECSAYDVPLAASPDLSARFTFITPNLINDMHDGTVADGDRFLQGYLPALMATPRVSGGQYRDLHHVGRERRSQRQPGSVRSGLAVHTRCEGSAPRTPTTPCCAPRRSCSGCRCSATQPPRRRCSASSASEHGRSR